MNLPDKFDVVTEHDPNKIVYNVVNNGCGGFTWVFAKDNHPFNYTRVETEGLLGTYWRIKNPSPNGINANGTPIYFDKTMLRMFDRVVTESRGTWLVTAVNPDDLILNSKDGWMGELYEDNDYGYDVVSVYAETNNRNDRLDVDKKGALRWKRKEFPVEDTPAQKQKKELLKSAEVAKKALEDIQKQINELGE